MKAIWSCLAIAKNTMEMIHLNQLALPTHPENDTASWPSPMLWRALFFV